MAKAITMKNILSIVGLLLLYNTTNAQHIRVHNSGNILYSNPISSVDSIKLDNTYSKFNITGNTTSLDIQKSLIDSITFSNTAVAADKIYIIYNGNDNATIINPYASQGLTITAAGGKVTATGTTGISNLEYNLLGNSAAGSLTMSSTTPAKLVLNNLNITNASGPAIIITGAQTHEFILQEGTVNTLSDGSGSAKNGTLQSDGKIIFSGTGSLAVSGIKKHGIYSSSSIEVQSPSITINSAVSDGLHSEGFIMTGGSVTVAATTGDGIDAGDGAISITAGSINITSTSNDVKAVKTGNGSMTISGGTFTLGVSGNASKAIAAKGTIAISAGNFTINLSGTTILTASGSGYDPSYCSGIKADAGLTITGGNFTIQTAAAANGAKAFSSDGNIVISNGTFNISTAGGSDTYVNTLGIADSYSTSAFSSDTKIDVLGGSFILTNSGAQGKGFSSDSLINISGGTITIINSGIAGKGFKTDKDIFFTGGNTSISLSGATLLTASGSGFDPSYPTGVKADHNISISSGTVIGITASAAASGAKGLSADSIIAVSGGTVTVSSAGNGAVYTNISGIADSYASAAFTSDSVILITGGTVTTSCSGTGGKGLKSDGIISIGSVSGVPVLNITTTGTRFLVSGTDYSHPKTIVAGGAINIINGNITVNSTDDGIHSDVSITISGGNSKISAISATQGMGEGVEAPIINFTGGVTNVVASNDGINATYGTVVGGTESNDHSQLNISGGILIVAGTDAIDSNGDITITGGTTVVCGPTNQPEEGMDFNGTFLMNGGLLIAAGSNSNMTKAMSTASTQVSMFLKSSAQLAASSMLHIENASGTEMVTFKPKNGVYYFHFSSANLAQSTQYKVYFGGSYTGGNYVGDATGWGLYTGGTYSLTGATLKTTTTTSASAKVNTILF